VIKKTIALLDIVGLAALDFMRSIPKAVHTTFLVFALVMVGQSAQAAPLLPTEVDDDPGSFIGCPSLAWATPLQDTSQDITGMIFGFAIIAGLIIMLISGIALLFARNRSDRASGAIEGVKNASLGLAIILIGVPVAALIIWGLATAFSPSCAA